jgi:hypothetical protein
MPIFRPPAFNVGAGVGVFRDPECDGMLYLRSIIGGTGITVDQPGTDEVRVRLSSPLPVPVQEIFIPWSQLEAALVDGIPDQPSLVFPQFGIGGALPVGSPYPAPAWQLQVGALVGVGGVLPLFNKISGAAAIVIKKVSLHWYGDISDAPGLEVAPLHLITGIIADAGPLDTVLGTDDLFPLAAITDANYGHITDIATWVDVSSANNIELPFVIFRGVGAPADDYRGNIFIRGVSFHFAKI